VEQLQIWVFSQFNKQAEFRVAESNIAKGADRKQGIIEASGFSHVRKKGKGNASSQEKNCCRSRVILRYSGNGSRSWMIEMAKGGV